jgi:hypothetical protein
MPNRAWSALWVSNCRHRRGYRGPIVVALRCMKGNDDRRDETAWDEGGTSGERRARRHLTTRVMSMDSVVGS